MRCAPGNLVVYFSSDGWRRCSPASLRGHIANNHFQADMLACTGVARYDLEVAAYRGIELDWVVQKAHQNLERPDADIREEISCSAPRSRFAANGQLTVHEYRALLTKNLKYIERLALAVIDWARMERSFPEASQVALDVTRDTADSSFFAYVARMNIAKR